MRYLTKKIVITFFLILSVLSCAKKNYGPASDINLQNLTNEQECYLNFKIEPVCLEIKWIEGPSSSTPGSFQLLIKSSNNPSLTQPLTHPLFIKLWMPSMGHGSSPVKIEKISEGNYLIHQVYFLMPGEWEIHFQLKSNQGDQILDEAILPLAI